MDLAYYTGSAAVGSEAFSWNLTRFRSFRLIKSVSKDIRRLLSIGARRIGARENIQIAREFQSVSQPRQVAALVASPLSCRMSAHASTMEAPEEDTEVRPLALAAA